MVAVLVSELFVCAALTLVGWKFPAVLARVSLYGFALLMGIAAYKVGMWFSNAKENDEPRHD